METETFMDSGSDPTVLKQIFTLNPNLTSEITSGFRFQFFFENHDFLLHFPAPVKEKSPKPWKSKLSRIPEPIHRIRHFKSNFRERRDLRRTVGAPVVVFFSGLSNGPESWLRPLPFRTPWYNTVFSARNLPVLEIRAGVSGQMSAIQAPPLSTTRGRFLNGGGRRTSGLCHGDFGAAFG